MVAPSSGATSTGAKITVTFFLGVGGSFVEVDLEESLFTRGGGVRVKALKDLSNLAQQYQKGMRRPYVVRRDMLRLFLETGAAGDGEGVPVDDSTVLRLRGSGEVGCCCHHEAVEWIDHGACSVRVIQRDHTNAEVARQVRDALGTDPAGPRVHSVFHQAGDGEGPTLAEYLLRELIGRNATSWVLVLVLKSLHVTELQGSLGQWWKAVDTFLLKDTEAVGQLLTGGSTWWVSSVGMMSLSAEIYADGVFKRAGYLSFPCRDIGALLLQIWFVAEAVLQRLLFSRDSCSPATVELLRLFPRQLFFRWAQDRGGWNVVQHLFVYLVGIGGVSTLNCVDMLGNKNRVCAGDHDTSRNLVGREILVHILSGATGWQHSPPKHLLCAIVKAALCEPWRFRDGLSLNCLSGPDDLDRPGYPNGENRCRLRFSASQRLLDMFVSVGHNIISLQPQCVQYL